MIEWWGNVWDKHDAGETICILTNGQVRKDGANSMGRGVALEARNRYPDLPYRVGDLLQRYGNRVFHIEEHNLFTFPTKLYPSVKSSTSIIEKSCEQLLALINLYEIPRVYIPRPGCGYGGLSWNTVYPIVEYLDNRFIFVTY